MNDLITIKTSMRVADLGVVMTYLEENGIKCHLKDEYFGDIYPGIDVKLQVAEEDVEKSLKLLIKGGFSTVEEYEEYSDPLTRFVNKIIDTLDGDAQ